VNDPPSTSLRQGTEEARSELDASLKTCWRQSHEIHSLNETIAVYRRGASSLATENAELRREVAHLRAQQLSPRSRGAGTPETHAAWPSSRWVQVGVNACGLVLADRVVAFVCWRRGDADDVSQAGGGAHGFWWFSPARPSQFLPLFEVSVPTAGDWVRARALAARAHVEDAGQHQLLREVLLGRRWLPEGYYADTTPEHP
jgi:hypothetical protein